MQFLINVFGFLWAVWGFAWFLLVVALFTIIYAVVLGIFGRKYAMQCVWINCRYLSPFLLRINGIRLKVNGTEKIDAKRTYVFVANHRAQLDIIAGASALPQPVKFLAKAEVKYIPFFGYMVKMLAIIVDRKSKESREKSYRYMVEALHKGESLFIYPEGTRNRTNEPLKEFKDGAFKVAIMAQVPIAVQTLIGTRELNDPRGWSLFPGTVEVHWSTPIETKGMTTEDVPKLKEIVRVEMMKYLHPR
ncbi:MAG: 1-acyl-sn-glycerol-3-phosphate acyltransferase [Chitinophagales bacterium]|nr:1-acyl-sn-glycerol-3-phosphate acyltransferase [Chitinophagales bacterium]